MGDGTYIEFLLGDKTAETLSDTVERLCAHGLLHYSGHDLRITAAGLRVLLNHIQDQSIPTLRTSKKLRSAE